VQLIGEKEIFMSCCVTCCSLCAIKNVIVASQSYDVADVQFTVEKKGPVELLQFIQKYNLGNYCNNVMVHRLVYICTKLLEPVTVQYIFLLAWGRQTQGSPRAAHTLATPPLGLLTSDGVSRLGLGLETRLQTRFLKSRSQCRRSQVSVSKDFGLGLELFVSRLCIGYFL